MFLFFTLSTTFPSLIPRFKHILAVLLLSLSPDTHLQTRYQFYAQTNTKLAETCVKLFNDVLSNVWMYLTKPMIDVATEFVKVITNRSCFIILFGDSRFVEKKGILRRFGIYIDV